MEYSLFATQNTIEEMGSALLIDLNYLTKFVVLIGFLKCCKEYHIKITDYVSNVITYQHKDIRFVDIINHKSGLEYTSNHNILHKQFLNSSNLHRFSTSLKKNMEAMGNYYYNNYGYNILTYTIYSLTGLQIDEYLETNLLSKIDYTWDKIKNIPIAGYGLQIYKKDIRQFLFNIRDEMHLYNFNFYYDKFKLPIKNFKETALFFGHSGKTGSYFYYSKKIDCLYVYIQSMGYYNLTETNYKDILLKKLYYLNDTI